MSLYSLAEWFESLLELRLEMLCSPSYVELFVGLNEKEISQAGVGS